MPQVFRRSANAIAIWLTACVLAGAGTLAVAGTLWLRSSFVTDARHPVGQPVPFSHEHSQIMGGAADPARRHRGEFAVRFGLGNVTINFVIASAKALIILFIFKGLKSAPALPRLALGLAALWLAIMYGLVLIDYATR